MLESSVLDEKEQCKSHRKIETGSNFFDVAGCEIENKFSLGELDVTISECASHPFFCFFNHRIGQSDDFDSWESEARIGFDVDFVADETEVSESFDDLYHYSFFVINDCYIVKVLSKSRDFLRN
jgi:hypothetical protein